MPGVRRRLVRAVAVVLFVAASSVSVDAIAASLPTVSSLSPTSGPTRGGTAVTLTGRGFRHARRVYFGGVITTRFSITSDTRLKVTAPKHAAAVVDVRVTTSSGTSARTAKDHYRYVAPPVITGVTPPAGPTDGGASVTITGSGFTRLTRLSIGGAAVGFRVASSTRLTAVTPAHAAGLAAVRLTGAYGTSATSTHAQLTYVADPPPPTVSNVATPAPAMDSVTLTWAASGPGTVVIRRADGPVAPASVTSGVAVAELPSTATSYTDTALAGGTTYSYALFGRDPEGRAGPGTSATTATLLDPAPSYDGGAPTPVVFVHGYGDSHTNCHQDVTFELAGPLLTQYYAGTPRSSLHPVEFYSCDYNGDTIIGYGPRNATYYPGPDLYLNTDVRHLAYELAWYLYDNFTANQVPVDLVGESLGGVILTWALQRVAAQDPDFPPRLDVPAVVTFSAPFAGYRFGCTTNVECRQLQPDADFVHQLLAAGAPDGTGGTRWMAMGSEGCDEVPTSTSLALPGVGAAVDYTTPCYQHGDYVWDGSSTADAVGSRSGVAFSGGLHSLALMNAFLAGTG
jgi:hypothetical protein